MKTMENKPTTDPSAYDLYLKGLFLSRQMGRESLEEAIRFFEKATKKDPKFAHAYAACANAYVLGSSVYFPRAEFYPRAKELVNRALELNPNSSEVHFVRGNLAMQGDLDWKLAEEEFQKAITLNPGNADAHFWYSIFLATNQRFEEARDALRESIRLAPLDVNAWSWLVILHALAGDIYAATTLAEEMRERDPTSYNIRVLTAFCYVHEGRTADALKEVEHLVGPRDLWGRFNRAALYAMLGKTEEAGRLVLELEIKSRTMYVPLGWMAALHSLLGEKEVALDLMEKDLREGDRALWFLYQFPYYDVIRNEPRFAALLRKYNLPTTLPTRTLVVPHVEEEMRPRMALPT